MAREVLSTLPAMSLSTAVSCNVAPTVTVPGLGVSVTDATCATVMVRSLLATPSTVSTSTATPCATAFTTPSDVSVATGVLFDCVLTLRPASVVSVRPAVSFTTALYCFTSPVTNVSLDGV